MFPKSESDGPDSERDPFFSLAVELLALLFPFPLPFPLPFPFVFVFRLLRRRFFVVDFAPPDDDAVFVLAFEVDFFVVLFFLVFLLAVVFFRFLVFLVALGVEAVAAAGRSVPAVRRLRCRIERSILSDRIVLGANSASASR